MAQQENPPPELYSNSNRFATGWHDLNTRRRQTHRQTTCDAVENSNRQHLVLGEDNNTAEECHGLRDRQRRDNGIASVHEGCMTTCDWQ